MIQNSQFKKRKVSLEEQEAQKEDRFLQGRQIAFMIYDYFQGAHDTVLDYLFMMTIFRNSLHDGMKFYCQNQRFHSVPNYLKLTTKVKRSIDQKLRLRNFDARNGTSKQEPWSRVERD